MKFNLSLISMILLFSSLVAIAQDEEIDNWSFDTEPLKEDKVPYFALAGGYTGTFFSANFEEMNSLLNSKFGFDAEALSSSIYMNGFEIFTGLPFIENIRAGFYTRTGMASNEMTINDLNRKTEFTISNSGINIEYAFVPLKNLALTFGSGFGWGKTKLEIYQSQNEINWGEIGTAQPSDNFFHSAEAGFLNIEPKINIEYAVQSWLAIRLGANYSLSFMEVGVFSDASWEYNQGTAINDFPDEITGSGLGIQFGVLIGLFNY